MKFRRLVSLLIIAVIIIAFFTNPKETDFNAFIQSGIARQSEPPLIEYNNKLLYSSASITYFQPISQQGQFKAAANRENYIGLFGRFWKVNN